MTVVYSIWAGGHRFGWSANHNCFSNLECCLRCQRWLTSKHHTTKSSTLEATTCPMPEAKPSQFSNTKKHLVWNHQLLQENARTVYTVVSSAEHKLTFSTSGLLSMIKLEASTLLMYWNFKMQILWYTTAKMAKTKTNFGDIFVIFFPPSNGSWVMKSMIRLKENTFLKF